MMYVCVVQFVQLYIPSIFSSSIGVVTTAIESQPVPAVTSRKQLREIKQKFGAQSGEYESMLKEMGQQRKSSMMSKT